MAKARRSRTAYSASQRAQVLAAARKDGLTAAQVEKKFGVKPVTYYSWRKKKGLTARRGRGAHSRAVARGGDFASQVRAEVQSKVRTLLPSIVRGEVSTYLDTLFATGRRGRPRRT